MNGTHLLVWLWACGDADDVPKNTDTAVDTAVDTDTAVLLSEVCGNGVDDDEDGVVDEMNAPDATYADGERFYSVAPVGDDSLISAGGSGYTWIIDGEGLTVVGAIDGASAGYWIPDVDGDGHADLAATYTESCPHWPYCTYANAIYSWSSISVGVVASDDYVATVGNVGDSVGAIGGFTLADGTASIIVQQSTSGTYVTWFMDAADGSDGALDYADARVNIDGSALLNIGLDPYRNIDVDGDGVEDLLAYETDGSKDFLIFSGSDVDHIGVATSDAVWTFDGQSTGRTGNGAPIVVSDLDNDGYSDIIGASSDSSYVLDVYSIAGPLSGNVGWEDVSTTLVYSEACVGGDVAVVGDIDGDAIDDFATSVIPESSSSAGHFDLFTASSLATGGTGDAETTRWGYYVAGGAEDSEGKYLSAADFDANGSVDLAAWHDTYLNEDGTVTHSATDLWFDLGE